MHAKGLSNKTVESVLVNNDSEEDLDSGNINESSESQYEKVIQMWKILPIASVDATTMWKKQKVENGSGTLRVHYSRLISVKTHQFIVNM